VASRILIYGVTGSGKTTLAAQIAERTGLPWHSVDDLTWEPGWVGVPLDEQRRRIEAICSGDRWILDTAYGDWMDLLMARVDLIVALDYPRWLSLARLLRRSARRVVFRELACNGNIETVARLLGTDSIVRWHFRSFARKRSRIQRWMDDKAGPPVLRFRAPRSAQKWLATLHPGGTNIASHTSDRDVSD
jgi:adenylate kinase family enzyme